MLYPVSYDRVVPRVSKSWVRASGTTQDKEVSLGAILHASSGQLVSRVGSRDRDYSRHASRLEGLRSIPSSVDSSSRSADIEGERCGQLIERSHAPQCHTIPASSRGLDGTGEASSDRSVGTRSAPYIPLTRLHGQGKELSVASGSLNCRTLPRASPSLRLYEGWIAMA